jgi:hypothetical protein
MGLRATATFKARDISGTLEKIATGAANGVLEVATQGQALSQLYAPVDTGALRESIQVKSDLGETSAQASWGPDVPYDVYVEFGTGKRGAASADAGPGPYDPNWPGMVPEPYQRPALDELRGTALDTIAASIKSEL